MSPFDDLPADPRRRLALQRLALVLGSPAALASCGGGGGGAAPTASAPDPVAAPAPAPAPASPPGPAPAPADPPTPPATEGPQVLRTQWLSQSGPMMCSVKPVNREETGNYNRRDSLALFLARSIRGWTWSFAERQIPAPAPTCRLVVDGAPATDWVAESAVAGRYVFDLEVDNGWHVAWVEARNQAVACFAVPFVVNDTGAPLPGPARPWTATNRFEYQRGVANAVAQLQYAERAPLARPLQPRTIEPYSTLLPKAQLWVRHAALNSDAELIRRWVTTPLGDVVIAADQKYFYADAITHFPQLGQAPRPITTRPGPRGVGTLAFVSDMRLRRPALAGSGNGLYFAETNGRVGFLAEDGRVTTLVGRHTPGLPVHADVIGNSYMHRDKPAHVQSYAARFVEAADWSQAAGPAALWEPFGVEVLRREADGSVGDRAGQELWIADTLNHRIVYADAGTAGVADGFTPARLAPAGYRQAAGPTGRATVMHFAGGTDGRPGEICNEPWRVRFNARDGYLYWTNFAGNSIARCRLDGSGAEVVLRCALQPGDFDLGLPGADLRGTITPLRLEQSRIDPAVVRQRWLRDGLPGTASCVRPTGLAFDSQGRLLWVEHYTYAVRRMDLSTRRVETLCTVLDENGGSANSGNNAPNLAVDSEGGCGPVDDLFVWCWSNLSDRRFDRNGVARSGEWRNWLFQSGQSMTNGPLSQCFGPNYGWGFDVHGGRIVAVGSAAGSQMVEITRRQPGDPAPDAARWSRGLDAWWGSGVAHLVLGPAGQGELGLPNHEEMATWDDARLAAFLQALGVSPASVADVSYFVRWAALGRA